MTVSERTLQRQCRWVVIGEQGWVVDEFGLTKGNRTKFVAYPNPKTAPTRTRPYRYYWKESLHRYPLEFWSEVLAYHIGSTIGVEAPLTFPATFLSTEAEPDPLLRVGALSQSLVEPGAREELVHGGDLLSIIKPDYDRKKGVDHSVQLIMEALTRLLGNPSLYSSLFRQFVFDALIGNSDRHQDNWGIKFKLSKNVGEIVRFVPAFDNGSSLGRELDEGRVDEMLANAALIDRFIAHGRAHVRWDRGAGPERVSQEELMRLHLETFDELPGIFQEITSFDGDALERAIRRVCRISREDSPFPSTAISDAREEFIVRLTLRRQERLQLIGGAYT